MFKIQKTEYINKTFRLPTELVKNMEIIAQNQGVSLSSMAKFHILKKYNAVTASQTM